MEWGEFPSCRITIMSLMWWCTNWICRLVCVVVCPSQSPTGYLMDPTVIGKYSLYILGSGVEVVVLHLGWVLLPVLGLAMCCQ